MRAVVDQMMLVSDERLIEAMRLAHEALGLVLEPAGAAGLAAALEHRAGLKGTTIAIPLCGGNVTPAQWRAWKVS
jgi:threonine dehydratase